MENPELELLGKIQDKLAGEIKWQRLLPDEWYEEDIEPVKEYTKEEFLFSDIDYGVKP